MLVRQASQYISSIFTFQLSVLLQRFDLSLKKHGLVTLSGKFQQINTFFDIKYFKLSSFMWGNCRRGDLNSQRPCTTIGHNFMQFSMVSMLGNLWTRQNVNENRSRQNWNTNLNTSSRVREQYKLIDAIDLFLNEIGTFSDDVPAILF